MAADDEVQIKFSADHAAMLNALQAVAEGLRNIGQKAQESGEKQKEAHTWAAEGIEHATNKLREFTSASGLANQAAEMMNQRLEAMREKGRAALDAQKELAGIGRAWQDYLLPSESAGAINNRLEEIGAGGMGHKGASQAFAQLISQRPEGATSDALLAQLAEASRSSPDSSRAADRAGQIGALQRAFPQFSLEGAAAEISSRGWGSSAQSQLGAIEGLSRRTGGRDSFEFLSGFEKALDPSGRGIDATSAERVAGMLVEKGKSFTQSASLQKNLEFFRGTDLGHSIASAMFGEIDSAGGGEAMLTAAGKLGIRSPEMIEPTRRLLLGRGALAMGTAPNSAAGIAAMRAQQGKIAAQPMQSLAASVRVNAGEIEGIRADDPSSYFAAAQAATDEALAAQGYWASGIMDLGTRPTLKRWAASAYMGTPWDSRSGGEKAMAGIDSLLSGVRDEAKSNPALEKTARHLEEIERLLREQMQNPKEITIHDGGDTHRATQNEAHAAARN